MRRWVRRRFFLLLFRLNDNYPSRFEVEWALGTGFQTTPRIYLAMMLYITSKDRFGVERAAQRLGCTRERIRQMIIKGCRQAERWEEMVGETTIPGYIEKMNKCL